MSNVNNKMVIFFKASLKQLPPMMLCTASHNILLNTPTAMNSDPDLCDVYIPNDDGVNHY